MTAPGYEWRFRLASQLACFPAQSRYLSRYFRCVANHVHLHPFGTDLLPVLREDPVVIQTGAKASVL